MTFAQPFKDYEILERIGAGAMGTVFKARQKRLDRIVALKVLKPSLARNTKFVERLRREARIVASLNHPDIVAGYDLGEEGGYHFFVMEFVEGRSLAALLKEWGSFPEHQVLDVAVRVASALDHAFQKGVIHRDVKPGNILIDASGRAKLTDMGLAKAPEDASLTQDGATVGTPQYISPEQARDPSKVDVRSDLYSLGATMFHMCTGQPPFPGSTVGNVIHDVIHRRAPSPRTINPGISPGLDLVIRKLLQKEPKARYQTPAELLADLERVRRAEPPHVDERALERGDGRRARLRFGPWAWAAVTAVVAALGAAWWWWPEPTRGRDATEPQHAFVQRVRASVDAAGDVRGKLRALAVASAEAATDRHRRAIDELRAGLLDAWRDELVALVRRQRRAIVDAVVEPERWSDPARWLRQRTVETVEQAFGLTLPELPAVLRQALDGELAALDAEVATAVVERDRNLLAAWAAHLRDTVEAAWRERLEQSDFVAAEAALRAGIDDFFGREGRPARAQLAATTAAEAAALEQQTRDAALQAIAAAEARAAEDLHRAVDEAIGQMRALLADDYDPRLLRERFAVWCADLAARHPGPSCFRGGTDPWPRVVDAERGFAAVLDVAVAETDRRRLRADVHLALAALHDDGDAHTELRWLRERAFAEPSVAALRDHWVQLLEHAHAARDWLLGALAERIGSAAVAVSDPAALGRTVQVAVRRDAGTIELVERDGARLRRLSPAALRVSELIELAPPPSGSETIARGLALWLYCAGENAVAGRRLPPADHAFFGEHVVSAVQRVLEQRLGTEVEARQALARLRREFREMPPDELREALDEFGSRFGETSVAASSAQVVHDLHTYLRDSEERATVLSALQDAVTPGLRIEMLGAGRARVTCDPGRAGDLPLPPGWQRGEKGLSFSGENVRLDAARAAGLVLAYGLSTEHAVVFEARLQFGAQGGQPRFYLFEVHGVGVALGLTASGEPFAAVVGVDDLGRDKALHRALEHALDVLVGTRSPVPVVPDARHVVAVEVQVQPKRLRASVRLDGVEVGRGSVPRPGKVVPRAVVMPMQPLIVGHASIEGRP